MQDVIVALLDNDEVAVYAYNPATQRYAGVGVWTGWRLGQAARSLGTAYAGPNAMRRARRHSCGALTPSFDIRGARLSEVARRNFGYQPCNPCLYLCTHDQTLVVGRALKQVHLIDLEEKPEGGEYAWSVPSSYSIDTQIPAAASITAMLFTGALAVASCPRLPRRHA